jgi:hypothetical protein
VADKLSKAQREAREQTVKALRAAGEWDGPGKVYKDQAAQLRAEAREMAKDQAFWDMDAQAERHERLANTVTAETEAKRDRQSARAKARRPRPWHKAADPILDELRGKHLDWRRSDLRRAVKIRLEKSGHKPPGADAIEDYIKSREEDGSLARQVK